MRRSTQRRHYAKARPGDARQASVKLGAQKGRLAEARRNGLRAVNLPGSDAELEEEDVAVATR